MRKLPTRKTQKTLLELVVHHSYRFDIYRELSEALVDERWIVDPVLPEMTSQFANIPSQRFADCYAEVVGGRQFQGLINKVLAVVA